jgi:hypothetical protein
MNKKIIGIFICMLFIGIAIPHFGFFETVKADPGDVILSFDSPSDYPTGLAWDGQYLWCITTENDSAISKIYRLDPLDGSIITSFDGPGPCFGLTWDGNYLWCSEISTFKIHKLDPLDGNIITSFNSPGAIPMGLTWDGQYLWNVEARFFNQTNIYKLNPSDGSIITSFPSPPGSNPTGLAWDGKYLWNADNRFPDQGIIYELDPTDGRVISHFSSPGEYPYGITWDGQYFWNSDISTSKIYKIDAGGSSDSGFIGEISGGFGVKTSINNIGSTTLYDTNWSIDVEAYIGLILSGSHTEDVIDELDIGESQTIQASNLRGIGLITINVQAADAEKQATAFLLGPLVLRVIEV